MFCSAFEPHYGMHEAKTVFFFLYKVQNYDKYVISNSHSYNTDLYYIRSFFF